MAALRGASMAAALALPCTLEASDFDDFRIPDHRARSMAMSLSTAATQSWGNSGAFEGESGSLGSGLTANGNWFRDSERIQTSTSFGLGGQGTRDRNENHMLDIGPSFVRRSDGEASTRDLREFWSLGLGGRVYPWTVPLSMGGNVTNYASYDQRWMDQRSVDMLQRPTPPNSQRFEAQSDANLWRYSYATLIDADAGLGRVRDATGVYRAQLLVDRLGRDGVLARAPSREARARLARLYYIESDYSVAHDRGAKFFWRDVEKILGEDGALGPAGLDAYSLQHALEPYFEPFFVAARVRRVGWFAGVQFSGFYRNLIARSTDHFFRAFYDSDTLVSSDDQTRSGHVTSSTRSPLAGLEAEYHLPLDMRWQLDAVANARSDVRGLARLTTVDSQLEVNYLLADRWAARGFAAQGRLIAKARGRDPALDLWNASYGAELDYYLEDRVKIGLTTSEEQHSDRASFGASFRTYGRTRRLFLGLSYSILRGFDAPGLVDPGRPMN